MRVIKLGLVLIAALYITGCATGAKVENMVYQGEEKSYTEELKDNVEVTGVLGGQKTNPAWTSEISDAAFSGALQQSLRAQGLLADDGQYELSVNMVKVEQPLIGLNLKVTTHIRYILTDTATDSVVFDELIAAPHTATIGDAFAAVTRLRLANEGSGMKNIEVFLTKLSELKLGVGQISLAK